MLLFSGDAKDERFERLVFSPDSKKLVGGTNRGQVQMWTIGGSDAEVITEAIADRSPISGVSHVEFSPDGRYLVLGLGSPPGLIIRDLKEKTALTEDLDRVTGLAVAPNGNQLVRYGSTQVAIGGGNLSALSWTSNHLTSQWSLSDEDGIQGRPRFLPDGERIIFCRIGYKGELVSFVTIHVAESGELLREFESPNLGITEPVVSPSGESFVVLAERSLLVWQTDGDSRPAKKVANDNRKHFTGLAFHPSGRYLAATSNDATVKLYDTESWQVAKTFTWNIGRLRSIAFSPDGTLAAVGSDSGKIVIWDVDL
jgi:WD40 repeat protein